MTNEIALGKDQGKNIFFKVVLIYWWNINPFFHLYRDLYRDMLYCFTTIKSMVVWAMG